MISVGGLAVWRRWIVRGQGETTRYPQFRINARSFGASMCQTRTSGFSRSPTPMTKGRRAGRTAGPSSGYRLAWDRGAAVVRVVEAGHSCSFSSISSRCRFVRGGEYRSGRAFSLFFARRISTAAPSFEASLPQHSMGRLRGRGQPSLRCARVQPASNRHGPSKVRGHCKGGQGFDGRPTRAEFSTASGVPAHPQPCRSCLRAWETENPSRQARGFQR